MRKEKKILAVTLTALMMIGNLTGCGNSDGSTQ